MEDEQNWVGVRERRAQILENVPLIGGHFSESDFFGWNILCIEDRGRNS